MVIEGPDQSSRNSPKTSTSRAAATVELGDSDLVEAAREALPGDSHAFDELVRRHEGHVRANCRFIVRNPETAEDLAQEVFVKAYFSLRGFEGRASFRTWIRRIKVNHCLNHRERQEKRREVGLDDPIAVDHERLRVESTAEEGLEKSETRAAIAAILDLMPDTLRIPLVLRDMDGFTYQEIAAALQINLSAVKMRIARGRKMFRDQWRASGMNLP